MTVARRWAESSAAHEIVAGFDQEASALLMARVSTFGWSTRDVRLAAMARSHAHSRRVQIRRVRAGRAGDVPHARSHGHLPAIHVQPPPVAVLQTANNSPDETAYRLMIGRETVLNSLVMIQPTLMCYLQRTAAARAVGRGEHPAGLHPPPGHLLHDRRPRRADHHVAQGELPGAPEHGRFRNLLAKPVADPPAAKARRCPTPRLVECDQGGSQARFLLAKLNPSATHATSDAGGAGRIRPRWGIRRGGRGAEIILTDDISLNVFMQHLAGWRCSRGNAARSRPTS